MLSKINRLKNNGICKYVHGSVAAFLTCANNHIWHDFESIGQGVIRILISIVVMAVNRKCYVVFIHQHAVNKKIRQKKLIAPRRDMRDYKNMPKLISVLQFLPQPAKIRFGKV